MSTGVSITSTAGLTPGESVAVKRALAVLHSEYPGWSWGVDIDGALMTLLNRALVGKWGYKINMLTHLDLDKEVMRGGGEFLERFNQARTRKDEEKAMDVPRDARQHMVPDL